MNEIAVKTTQYIFYLPLRLLLSPFVVINSRRLVFERTQGQTSYVIAGNHISILDPFLMCSCLPFKPTTVLMPYRFIVANVYYDNFLLRPGLWLLGGFRAYPHSSKMYGLELSYVFLELGQTVMIFPEGRVNRTNGKLPAKRGVAELAKHKNTMVIPVAITKNKSKIFKRFTVTIGKPESMNSLNSEQIMQKVWDLVS